MTNWSRLRIAGCLLATVGTFWVGGSAMGQVSQQRNQQYEGFILIQPGLESRVFKSDLDQKEFYWVDYGPDINTRAINEKMIKLDKVTLAVWVQVEGEMESGGSFGHLNQYEKRLLIRKVIKFSSGPVEQYRAKHR
ncbi:MAG: hypothetical protein ABSG71_20645 [Thermodesulfobacteriota bacterium]